MGASEFFRAQHGVQEVRERCGTQNEREQSHLVTYTWSQNVTNASMAANAASPRTTIPTVNIRGS